MVRPSRPPQYAIGTATREDSGEMMRVAPPRVVDVLAKRLGRLVDALSLGESCAADVEEVFRGLIAPWSRLGIEPPGSEPPWFSEISDDNTPVEFSVTLSPRGSEVRVLFEPQGEQPSLSSNRAAALAMHEELARDYGADLSRFRKVQDLFLPDELHGPFALWSAVVFARGKAPSFKAYFNTQARGVSQASLLVQEGLRRLGMPREWPRIAKHMAYRGPHLDELKYFALDLTSSAHSRVKVYVRHHESTPDELERAASLAGDAMPGGAASFARAVSGGTQCFSSRATFSCAAFTEDGDGLPPATTHYIPVCAYADNDAVVEQRVAKYLVDNRLDDAPYRRALRGFADRPLEAGVGMQSWVALRHWDGAPRLTVYLGSESRTMFPTGTVPAATKSHTSFDSAEDVVRCVAQYRLSDHPIVRRIAETGDAGLLWLLINNTYQGTSVHFSPWLASVTATVEDERVRSLLARQLNEEMGDGNVDRAHSRLMTSFLAAIEPLRPAYLSDTLVEPGVRLAQDLRQHYRATNQYEALAALMAGEICAQQLIATVAELLAPHLGRVDEANLTWLTHHNEVEGDHAEESFELARYVPKHPEPIASVVKGAFGVHTALWASMNTLLARWSDLTA